MKKKCLVLAVALATAPFAISAGELSYSYVEGGYARQNLDTGESYSGLPGLDETNGDPYLDGFTLKGSVALGDAFHLFGGYQASDGNVPHRVQIIGGIDNTFYNENKDKQAYIGVGYHRSLSERADFLSEISYVSREYEIDTGFGVFRADADGYRASVGFRSAISEHFEGWIKANYTDADTFDGDVYDGEFGGAIGGQFKFNNTWGLVGEVEAGQDVAKYGFGVRASF